MQTSIHSRSEIINFWKKSKNREDIVGGPSISFTEKWVVDDTFIQKSTNVYKCNVGIDASQLYPYSMCQPKPTSLYKRWGLDSEKDRFTPRQSKTRDFENMVILDFRWKRLECKIESFYTTGRLKKSDCFSGDGFYSQFIILFEIMGCFSHFRPRQEVRSSLAEEDVKRGSQKRELHELRRSYIQVKGVIVIYSRETES